MNHPVLFRRRRAPLLNVIPDALLGAAAYWKASSYSGTGPWLDLSGNGLNMQLGSAAGADTNDPLFLAPVNGRPYLYLPGLAGNFASVPDAAPLRITGDIDIRVRFAAAGAPATVGTLLGKYTTAGQFAYLFRLNAPTGNLLLTLTADGTASVSATSTGNLTFPFSAWARATWRQSDGRVQFFTSPDGVTWTQLGPDKVIAIASTFPGTSVLKLGEYVVGVEPYIGAIFGGEVRSGIDGTKVLEIDFTDASRYNSTVTQLAAITVHTVTINRAATGRKSSIPNLSLFLCAFDDYTETPDNAALDFAATDSFTLYYAERRFHATPDAYMLAKRSSNAPATLAGYHLQSTGGLYRATIGDGTLSATPIAGALVIGSPVVVALRRDKARAKLALFVNGAMVQEIDDTTGNLSNALAFRLAAVSGGVAGASDTELLGAAVFRRAQPDAEVAVTSLALLT